MKDLDNPIAAKAFAYALRTVKLYRYLVEEKKEFTMSKELLVSGTHIGKHVMSAVNGESRQKVHDGDGSSIEDHIGERVLAAPFAFQRLPHRERTGIY